MSRSLPIRRKVLIAFALPVLALSFLTGREVLGATADEAVAVDSAATFSQVRALQRASVAIGSERMAFAIGEVLQEVDEAQSAAAVEATDNALAELSQSQDSVLLDRVGTALSAARSTPVGRYDNFGRASALLLARAQQLDSSAASGDSVRSLAILQEVHRYIEAEDVAWIAFVERTSEDVRSSASVLQAFAVADQLRTNLGTDGSSQSGHIRDVIASTAVMSELRARAAEDVLNPEQTIVTDRAAILSRNDARARWVGAATTQADRATSDLDSAISEAVDRRNTAGLLGLFGLLVLGATAVVLTQSIAAPIATAAHDARTLVADRLPTMSGSFGTIKQTRPRSIQATSDDELGQLVTAINTIQDRFFDVAERESTARRQMSARTVTIANRNAALLHELVRNVSAWRNADASPEVRQRLFGIDHIATRMQRNIEAGLVLSGGRSERRWTKPISAINTARLALGEVVDFARVDISPMDDVRLHGLVAPDVAHVLAELIENGLNASAGMDQSRARVSVEGEWVSAGWAFLIHDLGTGLDDADRERINRALHTPGLSESSSTTDLGFLLIGKTADRFGIDIRLIERPAGGTTARIVLPVDLIDPETIPMDRKRIDAGRSGSFATDMSDGPLPANNLQAAAADAYFAAPEETASRRSFRRRKADREAPAVAPEVSPLGVEHDVNSELAKLLGNQTPQGTAGNENTAQVLPHG